MCVCGRVNVRAEREEGKSFRKKELKAAYEKAQ